MGYEWFFAEDDDAPPAEGLRSSTHCPVKTVLESFAEYKDQFFPFHRGVAELGDMVEEHVCNKYLRPNCEQITEQYEIPWEHGISHVDAACWGGEAHGTYEIKSYNDASGSNPNPSNANRWQVRRMMRLAERAGISLPEPWAILMFGKVWRTKGVFPVELLAEHRDVVDREIEGINTVMRVASRSGPYMLTKSVFSDVGLVCECGGCFPKPLVEAGATLSKLLDRFGIVRAELRRALEEKKLRDAEVKELKASEKALRERIRPLVVEGERHTDGDLVVSLTKNGVLTIKDREAKV